MLKRILAVMFSVLMVLSTITIHVQAKEDREGWKWVLVEVTDFEKLINDATEDYYYNPGGRQVIEGNTLYVTRHVMDVNYAYNGDSYGKTTWTYPPEEIPFGRESDYTIERYTEYTNVVEDENVHFVNRLPIIGMQIATVLSVGDNYEKHWTYNLYDTEVAPPSAYVTSGTSYTAYLNLGDIFPPDQDLLEEFLSEDCYLTFFYSSDFHSEKRLKYHLVKDKVVSAGHASTQAGEDGGTDIETGYSDWYDDDDFDFPVGPVVGGVGAVVGGYTIIKAIEAITGGKKAKGSSTPPKKQKTQPKKEKPKEEKKEEKPKKKSKFMMVVYKDFGDAIRPGEKPRKIGARIEERTPEGEVRNRDDLTRTIVLSTSNNLSISNIGLQSPYQMGELSAVEGANGNGIVNFDFKHLGTAFQKTLVFDIAGEMEIYFKNEDEWLARYDYDAIFGVKTTQTVLFTIHNATEAPKAIRLDYNKKAFSIKQRESEYEYSYYLDITNISPERPYDPIYKNEMEEIFITCVFDNQIEVKQSIRCNLVPNGLTFYSDSLKKDRIYVDTKKVLNPKGLDPEFKSSRFDLHLAYCDNLTGQTVIYMPSMKECKLSFSKLRENGTELDNFDKKYNYEIEFGRDEHMCSFTPKAALANMGEPKLVEVLVQCEHRGNFYQLELPFAIDGDKPPKRLSNWDNEYKLLKEAVLKYGLTPNGNAQQMIKFAKSMTANELYALRRAIYAENSLYYSNESVEFLTLSQYYDKLIFASGVAKFLGDQAFAFLVKRFAGDAVETFISPVKDLTLQWIGECIANKMYDGNKPASSYGLDFYFKAEEAARSKIVDLILKGEILDYKKVTASISTLIYLNILHHYYDSEDPSYNDLYKSIISSFVDVSFSFIMGKFGDSIHNAIKAKQITSKDINSAIYSIIKKAPASYRTQAIRLAAELRQSKDFLRMLYYKVPGGATWGFTKKPDGESYKWVFERTYHKKQVYEDYWKDVAADKTLESLKLSPEQVEEYNRVSELMAIILLLFDDTVQPGTGVDALIQFEIDNVKFVVTAPAKFVVQLATNFLSFIFSPITSMLPDKPKETFDFTCNYYFPPDETQLQKYGIGADDDYHYGREE